MERNLVGFAGKSELPGKPMLYKTTSKFLEVFGLKSLKELPSLLEIEELFPEDVAQSHQERSEILGDFTDSVEEEFLESYSVEEKELKNITDTIKGVSVTSEFFEKEKEEQRLKKF